MLHGWFWGGHCKYSPLIQVNITVSQPKQEHFGSHHFYQTAKEGDIF